MRLTHLKLAGFKSFVDPTTIHLHGQRVGVVGPNGCGKSNVMESVRWVLGESSAKEMRADAMDAVIFNGSANRKPISRASVELIFDNSLGGASGEWSQYAEISVKRVIEREKGSTYFINNTAVRRRDVADLFMGTGLGGRAYAIIGQNTIGRIVEAKPEELRVFLEEAAGISKYKERRRETELRLRDTRENLTRVEDICRELQKQITKLESQAITAQQYHTLQEALKQAEGQLWLLKKRDAGREWEKAKTRVEKLVNQLEAQMAELRKSEADLEKSRQAHYAASEAINTAQAAYYEANAVVSGLENQVKQNTEARERMQQQLQQLQHALERNANAGETFAQNLAQLNLELEVATQAESAAQSELEAHKQALPEKEAALRLASITAQASVDAFTEAHQHLQIARSNIGYLVRNVEENQQRVQKLEADLAQLPTSSPQSFVNEEAAVESAKKQIATLEQQAQKISTEEAGVQSEISAYRDSHSQAQRMLHQAEAEIQSLEKIQQSLNSESRISDWLSAQGLGKHARLWQKIKIEDTWSIALEAALGNKLNALLTKQHNASARPPGALVLGFAAENSVSTHRTQSVFKPLMSVVKECDSETRAILEDWLEGMYLLPADQEPRSALAKLNLGEVLVNQQGDIYSRHSVSYYGENTGLQGVLERQQRLENLQQSLPNLQKEVTQTISGLAGAEAKLVALRSQHQQANANIKSATSELHQHQLTLTTKQQAAHNMRQRETALREELQSVNQRLQTLAKDKASKEHELTQISAQLPEYEAKRDSDAEAKSRMEATFSALREQVQAAERVYQENRFNLKLINNNINELNNKINVNNEEKSAFLLRQKEAEEALKVTPMDTLKANLSDAINMQHIREQALAEARNQMAAQEQSLQALERTRMQQEQQLHPLRDSLEQSRLQEQEARLYFEQCQAGLVETGLNEEALAGTLSENVRTTEIARKSEQIRQDIEALGPVNLAAIQELATESERKVYLDSQMADLLQATETLEDAIRKIDRETRDRLMETYNTANQHFGELFSTLFGGGQAKLELLGDEILDTGVQVFAQPPGKKNTTIQLLSGGEKALTALALVFALFRLNPAPFCLMDEVDAPLDDSNTERFCHMVKKMAEHTQFLFVSHNKITMEMAQQLIGVTMQESGVSRVVDVDIEAAMQMHA